MTQQTREISVSGFVTNVDMDTNKTLRVTIRAKLNTYTAQISDPINAEALKTIVVPGAFMSVSGSIHLMFNDETGAEENVSLVIENAMPYLPPASTPKEPSEMFFGCR